eukprot:scaffold25495_cov121-Isochrysis_galbana.AAC.4
MQHQSKHQVKHAVRHQGLTVPHADGFGTRTAHSARPRRRSRWRRSDRASHTRCSGCMTYTGRVSAPSGPRWVPHVPAGTVSPHPGQPPLRRRRGVRWPNSAAPDVQSAGYAHAFPQRSRHKQALASSRLPTVPTRTGPNRCRPHAAPQSAAQNRSTGSASAGP